MVYEFLNERWAKSHIVKKSSLPFSRLPAAKQSSFQPITHHSLHITAAKQSSFQEIRADQCKSAPSVSHSSFQN
jgi:hypothetical protein